MTLILILTLSLLVLVSLSILFTKSLRKAVILNGVLSIIASFVYLILLAPDVALAEAVIGCTLSTIVMLMAIKHVDIIHVVYQLQKVQANQLMEIFSGIYQHEDYDVHYAVNSEELKHNIKRYQDMDYFVVEREEEVLLFSRRKDDFYREIYQELENKTLKKIREVSEDEILKQ